MGGAVKMIKSVVTGRDEGAEDALNAQTAAMGESNRVNKEIFDIQRKDMEPWRKAGLRSLGDLQTQMPELSRSFSMRDFQQDPGYQFRMAEGQKALERSAAARGGVMSGGTLKALSRYGQDFASNEFTNAYNRFNNDRDQKFNKLSSLAGVGQSASQQLSNAAGQYGQATSSNAMQMGNARAANAIAQGNAGANLINQGITAGALYFSDERLKTNVEPISKADIDELKSVVKPYKFNYIDPIYGKGDWIGVMAQDLKKTKLGKTVVVEDEKGLMQIDSQKLCSLLLAIQLGA